MLGEPVSNGVGALLVTIESCDVTRERNHSRWRMDHQPRGTGCIGVHLNVGHVFERTAASISTRPADVVPRHFVSLGIEYDPATQPAQIGDGGPGEHSGYCSNPLAGAERRCGSDGLDKDANDTASGEYRHHERSVR